MLFNKEKHLKYYISYVIKGRILCLFGINYEMLILLINSILIKSHLIYFF